MTILFAIFPLSSLNIILVKSVIKSLVPFFLIQGKMLFQSVLDYFKQQNLDEFYLFTNTSCNYGFYEHQGMIRRHEKKHIFQINGQTAKMNFLFRQWKKLLSAVFHSSDEQGITEKELLTIVDEAEQGGGINQQEGTLIRSAIEFTELEAGDIFTPRIDIIGIHTDADKEEIAELFARTGFSRLPVYEDNIDHIIGILYQKDFHNYIIRTGRDIREMIKPAMFILAGICIWIVGAFKENEAHKILKQEPLNLDHEFYQDLSTQFMQIKKRCQFTATVSALLLAVCITFIAINTKGYIGSIVFHIFTFLGLSLGAFGLN